MQTETAQPPLIAYAAPQEPAQPSLLRRRVEGLLRSRGVWALGDQAVVSLGNFITSLLLARYWHDRPELYGIFALCLSVVLFLNTVHAALITYPLTVHGATCDPDRLGTIVSRALSLTLCLAPILGLGLLCATESVHRMSLLPWVLGALVLWQIQETLRRAMLARLRHAQALPGDAIRYLGQAAAVWGLAHFGVMTPEVAFVTVAAASLVAAVVQSIQLRTRPDLKVLVGDLRPATAESWRMGRWLLLTSLVNVGLIYLTPWALSGFRGSGELARFSAMANIVGVTNPIAMSTCGLIVPAVAAACASGGVQAGRRAALRYALQGIALVVPYFVLVIGFPEVTLRLFYGAHSPYIELAPMLRVFAFGYGGAIAGQLLCAALNGLGESRGTFVATIVAAVANTLIAIPLILAFGLRGAVWSGLAPIAAYVGVSAFLFLRVRTGPSSPSSSIAAANSGGALSASSLDSAAPRGVEVAR